MDNVRSDSLSSTSTNPFTVNEELSFEDAWVRVAELLQMCSGNFAGARTAGSCATEGDDAFGGYGEDGCGAGGGVHAAGLMQRLE